MSTEKSNDKDVSEKLASLIAMERDVKSLCKEHDKNKAAFEKAVAAHEKRVAEFDKVHKIVDASDSFNKMVVLVDEIYTMYVAHQGNANGIYESIKLLLDSRARFSDQAKK